MSTIRKEDIAGYVLDEDEICVDCATDEDKKNNGLPNFLTRQDIKDDDEYGRFCDRCKKVM